MLTECLLAECLLLKYLSVKIPSQSNSFSTKIPVGKTVFDKMTWHQLNSHSTRGKLFSKIEFEKKNFKHDESSSLKLHLHMRFCDIAVAEKRTLGDQIGRHETQPNRLHCNTRDT
jgi:hypothetical protein